MEKALTRVKSERQAKPGTLPVLILPAEDHDSYLTHKALFSQAKIPTQVCTLPLLQSDDSMKWAIGNIALQIFCKAGGQPWKVLPTEAERCLIIGISQSHKLRRVDGKTEVEKYFAFSVMTDSSGLFQKVQVLGQGDDEEGYLASLRTSLRDELNREAHSYERIVVHTSFKLKRREIVAIRDTVQEVAQSPEIPKAKFAVVKVNHKSRFFGVNSRVNGMVPYEATRVRLGPGEYLVWFEGIFPDRPTVTKAFPGPTHMALVMLISIRC
jgi:argonaute-like protein implicated in RNA metabolism and viral defense